LPTPCKGCGSEGVAVTACSATQDATCKYCDCTSSHWMNSDSSTWTCPSKPDWKIGQRSSYTWVITPQYLINLRDWFGRTTSYTCFCDAGYKQISNYVCEACPIGTGSQGWTQATCTACDPGKFAYPAGSYCDSCPEGFYCASVSAAPVTCGNGYYCPQQSTLSQLTPLQRSRCQRSIVWGLIIEVTGTATQQGMGLGRPT
jgi:hypothetical protein